MPRTISTRTAFALLLTFALGLPGCGDDEPKSSAGGSGGGSSSSARESAAFTPPTVPTPASQSVPAEIAALMPTNTAILVVIESLDGFTATMAGIPGDDGPIRGASLLDDSVAGRTLRDAGIVATDRPLAVGMAVGVGPMGPEPTQTLIIPVTDEDDARGVLANAGASKIAEGYACVTDAPELPPLGFAAPEIPAGGISVHIDLAGLIAQFRPMVDPMLEMLPLLAAQNSPGQDPQALAAQMQPIIRFIGAFFDSAQSYSLGISRSGNGLSLHGHLASKPGSRLAIFAEGDGPEIWPIAGSIDASTPASVALVGDLDRWLALSRPMMGNLGALIGEEGASSLVDLMERSATIWEKLGDAGTFSLGVGNAKRMTFASTWLLDDATGLLDEYERVMQNPALSEQGMNFGARRDLEIDGTAVREYPMEYDFEKMAYNSGAADPEMMRKAFESMYPADPRLQFAITDDRFVVAMGGEKTIAEPLAGLSRSPGALPVELQQTLARVSGAPFGIAGRLDIGKFSTMMSGAAELMKNAEAIEAIREIQGLGPTPIDGYLSMRGAEWRHGVTVPAETLGRLPQLIELLGALAPSPGAGGGF